MPATKTMPKKAASGEKNNRSLKLGSCAASKLASREGKMTAKPSKKPATKSSKVADSTGHQVFSNKDLQCQFQAFCQASFADLRELAPVIGTLKSTIEFITNENFANKKADQEIFDENLFGFQGEVPEKRSAKLADMPVHLARLCETKLLKPEEERMLFCRMNFLRYKAEQLRRKAVVADQMNDYAIEIMSLLRAADWYRDGIVKANMRLVISIVKKFVNTNNVFEDLLSDGIIALIRAVDKFDFDRGFRFSTYATQVVRRNAYRNVMTKQKEKLQVTTSLSEGNVDVSDESKSSSMSESRWHELRSRLSTMLDLLDRREKLIIRARFSLGSHRNVKTLQCLADRLGVSKERVRQLEKRSLEKLRSMVGDDFKLIESANVDVDE